MVTEGLKGKLYSLRNLLKRIPLPGGMKVWVTATSLGFVLFAFITNIAQLSQLSIGLRTISWLGIGVFVSWLSLLVNAIAWKSLVNWQGYMPINISLVSLFLRSNLLKYLPGGIWHFIERLRALKSNIGVTPSLFAVFFEPLLMVVAAALWIPFGGWQSGLGLIAIFPAALLSPRFRKPLFIKLKGLKLDQIKVIDSTLIESIDNQALVKGIAKYPLLPLLWEMGFVFCRFGGFCCCLFAFSSFQSLPFGEWLAAFSIAWIVGLVVPAAPGGLGVFEASLYLRIGHSASEAPLLAALLGYRIISTLADVLAATFASGISFFDDYIRKSRSKRDSCSRTTPGGVRKS